MGSDARMRKVKPMQSQGKRTHADKKQNARKKNKQTINKTLGIVKKGSEFVISKTKEA